MNLSHNSETGSSNVFCIPVENINDNKLMIAVVASQEKIDRIRPVSRLIALNKRQATAQIGSTMTVA